MGILDDIAGAFSQGAAGFGAQGFGGAGYEAVWSQLKPWFAKISTNGVLKWLPRAATRMPCQVPEYDQGVPVGSCDHVALENCLLCHRPVCLNHAFVDSQGEAICYLCAVTLKQGHAPGQSPPQDPFRGQAAPPPPDAREEARQKAWWARGVLGVQEGVPWEVVKKQHRTLSAQHHPDKGGDENRFKDVQKAFDMLKLIYGEN